MCRWDIFANLTNPLAPVDLSVDPSPCVVGRSDPANLESNPDDLRHEPTCANQGVG